jgi:hypothetical protein
MYQCEPPGRAPFECAVIDQVENFTVRVLSTRNGHWEIENEITVADLLSPQKQLSNWTTRRIEPREIEVRCLSGSKLKSEKLRSLNFGQQINPTFTTIALEPCTFEN